MKTIPWTVIIGIVLTSCQATPTATRASDTPTRCLPLSFTLEIGIFPDRLEFYEGETFSISVDQENSYGGATVHLLQEGFETPITLQGASVIYPGNWGAVEVLPESGNKKFVLRALTAGTVVFHAELSADMPAFDINCQPMTSITNIRSDPVKIIINPSPGEGARPSSMAQPSGRYACEGQENGLIASIGSVTFNDDGGFLDQAFATPQPGISGTWHFDPAINKILFSDNIDFAFAGYLSIEDTATLYLQPGITRAHAEGGNIRCFKAGT